MIGDDRKPTRAESLFVFLMATGALAIVGAGVVLTLALLVYWFATTNVP